MKPRLFAMSLLALLAAAGPLWAQEAGAYDKYLWETYRVTGVGESAQPLVTELRAEVQKVLDAGPLASLRAVYADIPQDMYFMYWQGGRVITTLAYAYPYLTAEQQAGVKKYVQAELADPERAPWADKGFIPPDKGTPREIHSFAHKGAGWDRYWSMWGVKKTTLGVLYGLWLYGDRTGDWETIKQHYPKIVQFYSSKINQGDIYGTMGAHIAMARIARKMNDEKTLAAASATAGKVLEIGKDIAGVEGRVKKYWPERFEQRQAGSLYQGWMFLELCPEVGRFLAENVKDEVLKRHSAAMARYPMFWLREVPYGGRWTGDEGKGLPTELMGMLVPIERWVAGAKAETLAGYMRSAPISLGDCYWLESLVIAIESAGQTQWVALKD